MAVDWLTASDVSRCAKGNLSASGVRKAADTGRLEVAARTRGGIRLFSPAAVKKFLALRNATKRRRSLPRPRAVECATEAGTGCAGVAAGDALENCGHEDRHRRTSDSKGRK